jgi:signal transduction histidine kinase
MDMTPLPDPREDRATSTEAARPRRRHRLIRSAGVRFALLYAAVFGVSAAVLALLLWYSTLNLVQRQSELSISNDANSLLVVYRDGGMTALTASIDARMNDVVDPYGLYEVDSRQGQKLIGNIDLWPARIDQPGKWYLVETSRDHQRVQALAQAFVLSNGDTLLVGRDVRARADLRGVLRDGLIWALSIMGGLGLLGAVLIRSLFQRMIRDISTTTRAIARGDLSRRVPLTGDGDEFDELAEIVNDMLDRISRLMDGVRQVSNAIAHDLRTPITRARTRLEDASLHASSNADLHAAIERATLDLDGIVGVFEALLRIAEIEAGSRRAAFAAIDLSPTLADIDELYRAVAEERDLSLETSLPAHMPILGDRELIQQAVANLLDNALKYSPGGAPIMFSATADETLIEITVADRGPGISPAERTRATERFYRGEAARSTAGSGLGLALVAAVAQLHNGTLHLDDNHPGLRATISLPVSRSP